LNKFSSIPIVEQSPVERSTCTRFYYCLLTEMHIGEVSGGEHFQEMKME
jgi:hypothetical protein